ncbi:MAG: YggS family pyridoxal phosphate-dependent enzyme [Spirochaetia bacterium]|nr:YggS family pyridoxal phosphate-dependent enzyme [Spirochaetia bacterium]
MITEQVARNNLENLKKEIKQITDRDIKIIGVTKTHPESIYELCLNIGIDHIGENRIQELCRKNQVYPAARQKLKIHLIGTLQVNKVKFLTSNVDSLDTLSSAETLQKINERWNNATPLSLLLQVNCTGEEQKGGLTYKEKDEIFRLVKLCTTFENVKLEGLMTMGPTPAISYDINNPAYIEDTKVSFSRLATIRDEVQDHLKIDLPRLSMGMSHDYKIAIEHGATEIRIGSLLFGYR